MSPAPPPRWVVCLNVAALRRGLRLGSQHLLTVPGRTSGRPRSTPVSVVILGGERYIVAAFADASWVGNVRAAGAGTLTRGGTSEPVGLHELADSERGRVLRAFLEQVRGGRRFFGDLTADEIVANAHRYPVFRIAILTQR